MSRLLKAPWSNQVWHLDIGFAKYQLKLLTYPKGRTEFMPGEPRNVNFVQSSSDDVSGPDDLQYVRYILSPTSSALV